MTETEKQLKRIQAKLQQLLKHHSALQKENSLLREELAKEKKASASQHETIEKLRQQIDVLRYSNGEMNGADKKEFEKKINLYVKEIDRCITLLSQ